MIFSKIVDKLNSYQLDVSNYQNGVYIVTIETIDGTLFTQKLIKN